MADFPVLETDRLTLRAPTGADFSGFCEMWHDPVVMKFIGEGKTLTRQQSWERLLRQVGHWVVNGYGPWVVREKASGAFVGSIGFLNLMRDIEPEIGTPEVGWMLTSRAQGKGYATEAMRVILEWGKSRFTNSKLTCIIAPSNLASRSLAEKLGFAVVGSAVYFGQTTLIFEHPYTH